MLTEPEAAAIHYAATERIEPGEIVAVYDLGGGTFDAALLRGGGEGTATGARFELIGPPEGIDRLGGVDFDAAVFAHVNRFLGGTLDTLDLPTRPCQPASPACGPTASRPKRPSPPTPTWSPGPAARPADRGAHDPQRVRGHDPPGAGRHDRRAAPGAVSAGVPNESPRCCWSAARPASPWSPSWSGPSSAAPSPSTSTPSTPSPWARRSPPRPPTATTDRRRRPAAIAATAAIGEPPTPLHRNRRPPRCPRQNPTAGAALIVSETPVGAAAPLAPGAEADTASPQRRGAGQPIRRAPRRPRSPRAGGGGREVRGAACGSVSSSWPWVRWWGGCCWAGRRRAGRRHGRRVDHDDASTTAAPATPPPRRPHHGRADDRGPDHRADDHAATTVPATTTTAAPCETTATPFVCITSVSIDAQQNLIIPFEARGFSPSSGRRPTATSTSTSRSGRWRATRRMQEQRGRARATGFCGISRTPRSGRAIAPYTVADARKVGARAICVPSRTVCTQSRQVPAIASTSRLR